MYQRHYTPLKTNLQRIYIYTHKLYFTNNINIPKVIQTIQTYTKCIIEMMQTMMIVLRRFAP